MRAFGAEIVIIPSKGGLITPDRDSSNDRACPCSGQEPGIYLTDQMNNRDALQGYELMGMELIEQLPGVPSAFCAAVGIGGLLMGVASALHRFPDRGRIVALEPASLPYAVRRPSRYPPRGGDRRGFPASASRRRSI